jgi:hypothetical protein
MRIFATALKCSEAAEFSCDRIHLITKTIGATASNAIKSLQMPWLTSGEGGPFLAPILTGRSDAGSGGIRGEAGFLHI